ncbi:MAG: hypothetical protein AB7N76_09260 [Planctomycetota bacterium]
MPLHLAPLALVCALFPQMSHGVAPLSTGVVVAAPHEGFDDHTAPIAQAIAKELRTGWVVAEGYRAPRRQRWLDVNRPTQRVWTDGKKGPERQTHEGRQTYAEYQGHVDAAAGRAPLELLVEIHGHDRQMALGGKRVKIRAIELATRGFEPDELRALKARFEELVQKLPAEDRVLLAVEQLDESYEFRGQKVDFYFGASGSKRDGSLSAKSTRRALHFECPQHVRFDQERRARYTQLFIDLLRPLVERHRSTR